MDSILKRYGWGSQVPKQVERGQEGSFPFSVLFSPFGVKTKSQHQRTKGPGTKGLPIASELVSEAWTCNSRRTRSLLLGLVT